MSDAVDPVADDEILYRRVPRSTGWYDPASDMLMPEAFHPHKILDKSGLSVSRARYKSVEEAARGQPGKEYYVAELRAGDLRQHGIDVEPRPNTPDSYDLAHAELPDLNSGNRRSPETAERERLLAQQLCLKVSGPYLTPDPGTQATSPGT